MGEQVFSDITVVDLTRGIAGPYCTKLLASFGAEVIKVENPGEGDVTRSMGPFPDDEFNLEKSGLYFYLNTNKKSVTLNLHSDRGIQICKKLLGTADILVESFAPGRLARLGLVEQP